LFDRGAIEYSRVSRKLPLDVVLFREAVAAVRVEGKADVHVRARRSAKRSDVVHAALTQIAPGTTLSLTDPEPRNLEPSQTE
jgi:hypothetical protein